MATSTADQEHTSADNAHQMGRRLRARIPSRQRRVRRPLQLLDFVEDAVQFSVASVLLLVGAVALVESVYSFIESNGPFTTRITDVTNGILFVIIILEILTTVVTHFEEGGFQLKPFLIIGIISAVRHILSVGAQESLVTSETSVAFRRAQTSLGVNAGVVLALVLGLILVRKTDLEDNEEVDVK